jgi:hypothetical protein
MLMVPRIGVVYKNDTRDLYAPEARRSPAGDRRDPAWLAQSAPAATKAIASSCDPNDLPGTVSFATRFAEHVTGSHRIMMLYYRTANS